MGLVTKFSIVFLVLATISFVIPGRVRSQKREKMEESQLTRSVNQFSSSFYKETSGIKEGENLIMSPMSAQIILALLSLGARGNTQRDLQRALHLSDEEFTRKGFKELMTKLNSVQGVTLNIANKVYIKNNYELNEQFKKDAVEVFSSEAQNLNFAKNVEAAKIINTWVEDKTNNKIKDLISSDSLDQDTRLVLVNAIYFKGLWKDKFDPKRTSKRDFFVTRDNKIQVDMMHQTTNFPYAEIAEWDCKILELPYEKNEMSMIILLPNEVDGLKNLENHIATGNLNDMLKRLHSVEVNVALPKFKIETEIDLKKVLPKMGMDIIFDGNRVDLSGLLKSNEPLVVSEAIQKAFIEVNEEGAEAAAATGLIMMCRMMPRCFVFNAEQPFFYALRSGEDVLFIGKFIKPVEN